MFHLVILVHLVSSVTVYDDYCRWQ